MKSYPGGAAGGQARVKTQRERKGKSRVDIAGGTPCLACVQLPAPCVVTEGLLNARGS